MVFTDVGEKMFKHCYFVRREKKNLISASEYSLCSVEIMTA